MRCRRRTGTGIYIHSVRLTKDIFRFVLACLQAEVHTHPTYHRREKDGAGQGGGGGDRKRERDSVARHSINDMTDDPAARRHSRGTQLNENDG